MYSYHAAAFQGHVLSHWTVKCILTRLQHIRSIFCPIEQKFVLFLQHIRNIFYLLKQKDVFSLCCIILGTFFVPWNRNMYSHYAASSLGRFLSHETETCILTMLQHVRDIFCPIEQEHVLLPCCNMSETFFVPLNSKMYCHQECNILGAIFVI